MFANELLYFVCRLFRSLAEGQTASELLVRVNHTSARLELDLQAVLQGGTRALNTVLVPKVNSAEELYHIATLVDSMTSKSSNLQLIASIESARAILDLKEVRLTQFRRHDIILTTIVNTDFPVHPSSNRADVCVFDRKPYVRILQL